jgi:thiol:disulfide interchange protein DsbD
VTFERIVGFIFLATVIWLLYPLGSQIGAVGLLWTLVFLLFISAPMWVFGKLQHGAALRHRARTYAIMATLIVGGWLFCFRYAAPLDELAAEQIALRKRIHSDFRVAWNDASTIPWLPYTQGLAADAVRAGRTVFVDYTADWCANCKFNERVVLETAAVRDAMRQCGVVPFKADYTSEDPEIKADLDKYGRGGVPVYVVIPPRQPDRAVVLPEVITQQVVLDALEAACTATAAEPRVANAVQTDASGGAGAPPRGAR